ncbi:MAG: crossover junction endodeoxyribonuclease RuvC [Pseudomonadota bacterium]
MGNAGRGIIRILGIDPGLVRTGWGMIEAGHGRLRHLAHGVIAPATNLDMASRLVALEEELAIVIADHRPDEAAVEETFVNNNPSSTLKLGMARGITLMAPAKAGLLVGEYSANHIKRSVVGTGHAAKQQIALMVRHLLPTCGEPAADAADALAVAICHAHHRETDQRVAAARSPAA